MSRPEKKSATFSLSSTLTTGSKTMSHFIVKRETNLCGVKKEVSIITLARKRCDSVKGENHRHVENEWVVSRRCVLVVILKELWDWLLIYLLQSFSRESCLMMFHIGRI